MLETKEEVQKWLDKYGIGDFTINADLVVDVNGDVNLHKRGLITIPIKFGVVNGYFSIGNNPLTSLEGCPETILNSFYCDNSFLLVNLIGGPKKVLKNFSCCESRLISLEGCPSHVGGAFNCSHNSLASLEFCPEHVGGGFFCYHNVKLGDWQHVFCFDIIHNEHKRVFAEKEMLKLEDKFGVRNVVNSFDNVENNNHKKIKL